jgi:hypothetical protein
MSITKCAEHPALKTSRLPFFADKFDVTRIHSLACPQFRTKTHPTPPPGKGLNSGMHIGGVLICHPFASWQVGYRFGFCGSRSL